MRRTQPLYLTVADRFAEDISTGRYPVGSSLATESALCEQFRTSRFTVREAVKRLQARGLVVTRHGTGTEVLARYPTGGRFVYSFDSVSELMHAARDSRLIDIEADDVRADRELAEKLKCAVDDPLLKIQAVRVIPGAKGRAGKPIALLNAYVLGRFSSIKDELEHLEGAIGTLIERRYGVTIARIEQTVTPCVIAAKQARILRVQPRSLGLHFERTYISGDNKPFEYVSHVQAGDQARLTMTIRASDGG